MGLDFLDLNFRVEKRFGIRIPREKAAELLKNGNTSDPPPDCWTDIRVSDFVALIESLVAEQNPECKLEIFAGVKQDISECGGVDESEVTPEAWLYRDIGFW